MLEEKKRQLDELLNENILKNPITIMNIEEKYNNYN
jgi:hypothetical protein